MTSKNRDIVNNINNQEGFRTYKQSNCINKLSSHIISRLESTFFWYGRTIARKPFHFILFCLLVTVLCSLGILKFTKENRPFKLWIPQNSDFIKVMEWQSDNFPQNFRAHIAIYEANNVLTKEVILEMFRVHNLVASRSVNNITWSDTCAKLPTIDFGFGQRKRSAFENEGSLITSRRKRQSWWLSFFTREDYCQLLETMEAICMEHSILEIWGYDNETLNSLTDEDIIKDINEATKSSVFGIFTNFSKFLGEIQKSEGLIIGAKAMKQVWITEINEEEVKKGNIIDDTGTGMVVDKKSFEWESLLINSVLNNSNSLAPKGINIYLMAMSSFGHISGSTIKGDAKYLGLGFCVVFIYVQVMLGKFNMIEQRPLLSLLGISCVWMSIGVSYGLCSLMGVPFGPVNNVLPFLLLGLGIDDMFVIIQAWNNLESEEKENDLDVRIGLALKHAGVSITITSLTDFVAFAIGCSTVLPALRSFCLYAAIGIISIYFFQATYFVAWFSLDQKRLEDSRNGLMWCVKLKNWRTNKCSQRDLCQSFFKNVYSNIILKVPCKIFVILFTFALLGVSSWGVYNLKQEFNPIWFLPQSSYLFKFFVKLEEYFPSDGDDAVIYFGNLSLVENLNKIDILGQSLRDNQYIGEVDSWYDEYKKYWINLDLFTPNMDNNETAFLDHLSEFLYSPVGSKYRFRNFKFDGETNCLSPTPAVLASSIEYRHIILHGSSNKINAMESVKEIVRNLNFSGYVHPWARIYSGWETDKIIEVELYRNLSFAMIVVGIMTITLIASVTTSLMVLICVAMTLVDVGALMHWWGLTIDTVSCIDLVLAIGLCVDYAAHIGHTFMTQKGSRNERVKSTLAKIGPAVLNGGFSTFLAFVFLAGSDSHVFKTFFKIFFAVCLFGLYHGLVFLPVVLSIIGPKPYEVPELKISNEDPELEIKLNEGNFMDPPVVNMPETNLGSKVRDAEEAPIDDTSIPNTKISSKETVIM